ncbi:MAG TPA: GNAT family N-acetyltransferase [Rhizobiales bacterium]|nr:GNAT family N-acetyltransferase [Hyphomicrobiales bacterium]
MSFIAIPSPFKSSRISQIFAVLSEKTGGRGSLVQGAMLAFVIRVASAALAFLLQVLLARWMGAYEFGLFAYVWVWVIVLGTLTPLGLNSAVLRFVPQYLKHNEHGKLRGVLFTGRWVSFAAGSLVALAGAVFLYSVGGAIEEIYLVPFFLGFICLPLFSLTDFQEGVGRACSWIDLALVPPYILRPVLLLLIMFAAISMGAAADAQTALVSAIAASWLVAAFQYVLLRRRLEPLTGAGERRYDFPLWMKVSLPLLLVEGFSLLMFNTDILVMSRYLGPVDVAHYFAAVKVTGLISFVYYAVVASSAQRFARYDAKDERQKLQELVRQAARWTFWPSLAAAVVILLMGWPLLWLFGRNFTAALPVMFVLTAGLLVRAFVGPLDYVLNMLGEQNISALALGCGAALNLVLNILMIPQFGLLGAAASTAISFTLVSVLLAMAAYRRLGLCVLPFVSKTISSGKAAVGEASCMVQLSSFSQLQENLDDWQALSNAALAANPLYSPDMARAAFENLLGEEKNLHVLSVWRPDSTANGGRMLVGLFPFKRRAGGLVSWHHLYSFCTAPLVHKDHAHEVFPAFLNWLAQNRKTYRMPIMPMDGEFYAALEKACNAQGAVHDVLESYERAILPVRDAGADILEMTLSRQRRKTLARQWRRLEKKGKLDFRRFAPGDDIRRWADDFLELESRGWKGRKKTAMGCDESSSQFLRRALVLASEGNRLEFYALRLNGRNIAMSMAFQTAEALFFFKMAYDETCRANSPGMQLFARITRHLGETGQYVFADSCSTPDHPLLDHMWAGRRAVGHVLIGAGDVPGRISFAVTALALRLKIRSRLQVKRLYYRLRSLRT